MNERLKDLATELLNAIDIGVGDGGGDLQRKMQTALAAAGVIVPKFKLWDEVWIVDIHSKKPVKTRIIDVKVALGLGAADVTTYGLSHIGLRIYEKHVFATESEARNDG